MEDELLNDKNECRVMMREKTVPSQPKRRKEVLIQVLFGLFANMISIAPGMNLGFSAVALPEMQKPNATFQVHGEEASWIASIASISTPLGCILTGAIIERFGRRPTLMLVNIPSLIGWLCIAFANGNVTLMMIYVGRFFTGLSTGMSAVPATVYAAEMSCESLRGMFITWNSISMSLGILFVYLLGYVLQDNWRMVAGISAIFPALSLILIFLFLPETPSWLMSKGEEKLAEISLQKMRGISSKQEMPLSVANEFETISKKFKCAPKAGTEKPKKSLFRMLLRKGAMKPLIIMNAFFFFQQFSGIFVIIFYAVDVVVESDVVWDPYVVTIFIGLFRVIVTVFMSYVCKKYGRRPPSIVSGAGMTICMGCLATFLYLKNTDKLSEELIDKLSWIPVTCLLLYIVTSTIGFLTLPWAMIGEVFPSEVRGLAGGITTCLAYIFNFIVVKFYPDMRDTFFDYGTFFFYGTFAVIGTIFVVLFLPETRGKTLLEIEEYFSAKKPKKKLKEMTES